MPKPVAPAPRAPGQYKLPMGKAKKKAKPDLKKT
jgi:hypothetical protein